MTEVQEVPDARTAQLGRSDCDANKAVTVGARCDRGNWVCSPEDFLDLG